MKGSGGQGPRRRKGLLTRSIELMQGACHPGCGEQAAFAAVCDAIHGVP